MGDVAQILGVELKTALSAGETAAAILAGSSAPIPARKMKKPKGMSREVFDLMGPDGLVPAIESSTKGKSSAGFKDKRISSTKGKWVWAPFKNSARSDEQVSHHWQKADVQYHDYPWARFNVKLDVLNPKYTDEEYANVLTSSTWTRSETDHLMYIAYKYDLRWPVITDRYTLLPPRCTEDLQNRYLNVVSKVRAARASNSSSTQPMNIGMNLQYERNRRIQQEYALRRTKEEQVEVTKLKEQLKTVESVLRKHKKMPVKAEQLSDSNTESGGLGRSTGRGGSIVAGSVNKAAGGVQIKAEAPPPEIKLHQPTLGPGRPSLQTLRLSVPDQPGTLSTTLLRKMVSLLKDLGVPERPIATRSVCDSMDTVRKQAITLLSLQNSITKREREIASLRTRASSRTVSGSKQKAGSSSSAANMGSSSALGAGAMPGGASRVIGTGTTALLSQHGGPSMVGASGNALSTGVSGTAPTVVFQGVGVVPDVLLRNQHVNQKSGQKKQPTKRKQEPISAIHGSVVIKSERGGSSLELENPSKRRK